jgi:hypothetical protein
VGELPKSLQLQLQLTAPFAGKSVGLFLPRFVAFIEGFDPLVLQEPSQRAIERTGAQSNPPIAESVDILDQGISVFGLVRQADQNQEHRLSERLWLNSLRLSDDVSHGDIL